MIKNINLILYLSIGLFLTSIFLVGLSQWAMSTNPNLSELKKNIDERIEYIKTEKDIEKLRSITLAQAKTSYSFDEFTHEVMHNSRKIFLTLTIFAVFMIFCSYKIKKKFLTNSSSGTGNP